MFQNKSNLNKVLRNNSLVNKNLNKKLNNNLFTKEYEINDVKISVRNILTKGQTHEEISQYSGASISTRGRYISPSEKTRGVIHDRPLYLFIQGNNKNDIDLAVQKIEEIIQRESVINVQNSNNQKFIKFQNNRNLNISQENNGSLLIEKIMVGLDHAPEAFDLKGHVIGSGGANLQYIRNETGAMATLRGKGSGYIEPHLGFESNEPMHLFLEHTIFNGLQAAKQLAKNLIETIQQELVHFQQLNPPIPANLQITQQPTIVHSDIFQQQPPQQPINISQNILAVPPPIVQHNGIIQQPPPQTILQPQNFIQSNQQTLVPIQIHHQTAANMMIQQQTVEHQTNSINLNIPPPGIHVPVKTGQLVQIQGTASHLSHPPPNIQIQPQQQPAQILLNQTQPTNYQLQYVQQQQQQGVTDQQAQQVTIQHIYQAPQQIHGIVQQTSLPNQFDQIQVRGQQVQATQQYITLPGNTTTFMMPPPNVIQPHQSRPIQNVIYSSTQPQQQQVQQQMQYTMPNELNQNMNSLNTDEKKLDMLGQSSGNNLKNGIKCEDTFSNKKQLNKINSTIPQNVPSSISIPFTQMPPPIPPPNIQQFMEQQQQQQAPNQQICQVPVSIPQHQLQIPNHNITGNGGFILNNPQWQTPQSLPPPPPPHQTANQIIQNINMVAPQQSQQQQIQPQNTFRNIQDGNQNYFNGVDNYAGQQVQIQFHQSGPPPPPPPPISQHINIESTASQQFIQSPQRFHLQPNQQSQSQPQQSLMQQQNYILEVNNKMNQQRVLQQIDGTNSQQQRHVVLTNQVQNQGQALQQSQQPMTGNNNSGVTDSYKQIRKRKSENDGDSPPISVPKMGMGLLLNERETHRMVGNDHPSNSSNNVSSTTSTTTTTSRTSSTSNLTDETSEIHSGFVSTTTTGSPQQQIKEEPVHNSKENSQFYSDNYYDNHSPNNKNSSNSQLLSENGGTMFNGNSINGNNSNMKYQHHQQFRMNNNGFMMGVPHIDGNHRYNNNIKSLPPYNNHRNMGGIPNNNHAGNNGISDSRFRGQW